MHFFYGSKPRQKKFIEKKSLLTHLVSFYLLSTLYSLGSKLRNSGMQPVRIVSLLLVHAPMLLLSQSISDCAKEGLYLPLNQPVFSGCSACLPGSYCPEGSLLAFLCPPGTYQDLQQKGICQDCLPNHYCAGNGTSLPTPCPEGRVSAASSSSCGECDYANFLYNVSTRACQRRTVYCNLDTHYELPSPFNRTRESVCMPLTRCNTARMDEPVSAIFGNP